MIRRTIFVLAAVLLFSLPAFAQLPPGMWWRQQRVANQLALTEDQQTRLDVIWRGAANDLIDVRGEIEKMTIALKAELDQPQLNRAAIRQIAVRLNDARSKKFEREIMMFVDMRAVLTDPQWNRMREFLNRMEAENAARREDEMQQRRNMRPNAKRPQR